MLKEPDGTRPGDVVIWVQKAFSLADQLEDSVTPGLAELKVRGSKHFVTFLPLTMERSDINTTNSRYLVVSRISGCCRLTIVSSPRVFHFWIV